jgi:hypothetical protein
VIAWCWPKQPGVYWLRSEFDTANRFTLGPDGLWSFGMWGGWTRQQIRLLGWRGIPYRMEGGAS